ncbi:MAG: polyphosphate polymerase domain-containing protein [Kiritimatiellia bacterium]|jgi:hypothetical protein|nr:polyphosphate polymerase domain-containing protein [Kiritimatiellia bacterium]MDP6809599.1 polyphosphate polymerase domain-containing protein [Kiritimatiellia bacterium]MDP7023550.1 polyphosphate polymerase domain-containing protein [Kiritimatiellia bacterium]
MKRSLAVDIQLERHEAKYVLPPAVARQAVEFAAPFCTPDPHGSGSPAEYVITTLQLDNRALSLHRAKELEATNRFKLRVRTYGEPGSAPVFMEVKQKLGANIVKSRSRIPFDRWGEDLIRNPEQVMGSFDSAMERAAFLTFVRLAREIGAEPFVLVRYTRESYFGSNDHYARISVDRKLTYQPTRSWDDWGRGGTWRTMDTTVAQRKDFVYSGVVLELKTLGDAPVWMIDLVEQLGLERMGNCKYSTAIWQELSFRGMGDRVVDF